MVLFICGFVVGAGTGVVASLLIWKKRYRELRRGMREVEVLQKEAKEMQRELRALLPKRPPDAEVVIVSDPGGCIN